MQNPTLKEALSDYYRTKRGKYSPESWKSIQLRLEDWRRWVNREFPSPRRDRAEIDPYLSVIADPDARYMERYFNGLRNGYAPTSFNTFRQFLVSFWKYCRDRGWTPYNPMMHVDPMRIPRKVRLRLSAEEMLTALEDAIPRDRIALAIGMNTALRAGDVMSLNVGSVDLTSNTLYAYIDKTDKELPLPITAELRVELLRWFDHYAESTGLAGGAKMLPNNWTLVPPGQYCGRLPGSPDAGGYIRYKTTSRYTNPERIVQAALRRLGHETKGEGFHTIRRSVGRQVYELAKAQGIEDPITMAQSLLDHQTRSTTELYLGVKHEQEKRDAMLRGKSFLGAAARAAAAAVNDGVIPLSTREERSA